MKTLGLEGKTILVTGALGFLGHHICNALLDEGVDLISVDLKSSGSCIALDISDRVAVDKLVSSGVVPHGIVNNAAHCLYGEMSQEQFKKVLDVNIAGTDNMIAGFAPVMADSSKIVNIASIYGLLSPDFRIYGDDPKWYNPSVYGATKAAIIQMTKYYAARFAPLHINAVSPGGIFNDHDEQFSSLYSDRVPIKRMAKPEEIVNAIMFLLSPMSNYITGHNLVVDGGLSIW